MQLKPVLPHVPGDAAARYRLSWYLWRPPVLIPILLLAVACPLLLVGLVLGGFTAMLAALASGLTGGGAARSAIGDLVRTLVLLAASLAPGGITALLAVTIWVWPRRMRRRHAASDAEFDAQLVRDLAWLKEHGQQRLNLEQSGAAAWGSGDLELLREPLSITEGFWRSDLEQSVHVAPGLVQHRRGRDRRIRHRVYRITVVYTLQHHMSQFICEFDVATGLILTEHTKDAHYKDIVALKTRERSLREVELPGWWIVTTRMIGPSGILAFVAACIEWMLTCILPVVEYVQHTFNLELTSGGAMDVPFYSDPERERSARDGLAVYSNVTSTTITALRNLLREKRQGVIRLLESAA